MRSSRLSSRFFRGTMKRRKPGATCAQKHQKSLNVPRTRGRLLRRELKKVFSQIRNGGTGRVKPKSYKGGSERSRKDNRQTCSRLARLCWILYRCDFQVSVHKLHLRLRTSNLHALHVSSFHDRGANLSWQRFKDARKGFLKHQQELLSVGSTDD